MTINPQRAQALFLAALELSEPAARRELLDRECGSDTALRLRLEALLEAHDASGGFDIAPSGPAMAATIDATAVARTGSILAGRYKLIEAIGEGGMGTVWLAEQKEPVKRKVAVKLVKAGMDSRQVLSRFEAERQALAVMDHPNIAKVFDGGMTEHGRPFFVMEFVKGVPLTEYCDRAKLNLKERLALFISVCQAVQHAHQKGIIHRDLKPSNILVCLYDGQPVPKVIDFGLAKAMYHSLTDQSLHTEIGMMVGTPMYMSPEQAEHNNLDVDTRTDIYSLGVILYELLTGTTPLERQQLKAAAYHEILRLIKEVEPAKPSTRLSGHASLPSVAAQRSIEPNQLRRCLIGELDWIVMKALDKVRSRRYETANGLARDVERFLAEEAVEAGPPSSSYRLRKFAQKHRAALTTTAVFAVTLVLGTVTSIWLAARAMRAEEDTRQALVQEANQRTRAEENQRIAENERANALIAAEKESVQRAEAENARDQTQRSLDSMTSALTGDALTSQAELSDDQKNFLSEVLTYYKEFSTHHPDDERGMVRSAKAAVRVGEIESRLGRKSESASAFETAGEAFSTLVKKFPSRPEYRLALARSHNDLGFALSQLGKPEEEAKHYEEAMKIQEQLVSEFDSVDEYKFELAITCNKRGLALNSLRRSEEALELCNRGLNLLADFRTGDSAQPNRRYELARCHGNLAMVLNALGKYSESLAEFRKSLTLQQSLVDDYPEVRKYRQDLAINHSNVGLLVSILEQKQSAIKHFLTSISIREKLAVDYPSMPDYRRELAKGHGSIGEMLASMGRYDESEKHCRSAVELLENLVHLYPKSPVYRQALSRNYTSLGIVLNGMARNAEAVEQFGKSLSVFESLVEIFPSNTEYLQELAVSNNNLGALLIELGRREEALVHHQKALEIRGKLIAEHPNVGELKYYLSYSQNNLGSALADLGRYEEGSRHLHSALETCEKLVKDNSEVKAFQLLRGMVCFNLGDLLLSQGLPTESVAFFEKCFEIQTALLRNGERDTTAEILLRSCRRGLAKTQLLTEQRTDVDLQLSEGSEESGWNYQDWYDLACVYSIASSKNQTKRQEYSDRAFELLKRAIDSGWKDTDMIKTDTELNSLRDRDDFRELLLELKN